MHTKQAISWPDRHAWMHDYLMQKPGAVFERKESWNALLYRLHGKIFALLLRHSSGETLVNVKCDPFISIEFREACPHVRPGWHMNKLHWLSMHLDGKIPREMSEDLISISYELVRSALPGRLQKELAGHNR